MKHKSFLIGIISGISLVAFLDLLFIHILLGLHRTYYSSSVDIVEPLIALTALVVFLYTLYKEFKK